MAKGDQLWHRGWSDRTNYGAMDGPAGPTVRGTIYGMTVPYPLHSNFSGTFYRVK